MENIDKTKRSKVWTEIYSVVSQIPRKDVEGDAMDYCSASTEIEFILNKHKNTLE